MAHAFSTLEEARTEIDRLDAEIVRILGDRSACVSAAADFKKSADAVRAPERLASMIAARRGWAEERGIDPDFVESLFRLVTSHFINREMKEWSSGSDTTPR